MDKTTSSVRGKKLKEIRNAEGLTQQQFADLTGISLSTIKNYETGQYDVGLKVIDAVLALELFEKYMMWIMTGKSKPEIGQISPALSPAGSEQPEEYQGLIPVKAKSPR